MKVLKQLEAKWQELVTPKRLSFFLTILYLISLIPLLWIGFYNYPSADDYSIGLQCRQAWESSHNLLAVIGAAVLRSLRDWFDWMGYFTSNFLMALQPGTFGERFYILTPFLMIGMLSLSTWYLLKTIFVRVFGADRYSSNCVIMLMLFVTVHCMVGRVEAFYWYSGAANYILVHSFSLFFYGLLIAAVYDTGARRTRKLILASVLGFLVGGGNQMTALNAVIVLAVAAGFLFYQKKWKKYRWFLFPLGANLLGFLLNVAAPGNWVRAEGATGMNPVKAVLVSFYYCLDYCLGEWSGWPVALLILALLPLCFHMAKKTSFGFPCPLVVIGFGYCVVSAMMTPPLFAMGNMEAARLQALTFAMYILVLTLCVGYAAGWARRQWEKQTGQAAVRQMDQPAKQAGQADHAGMSASSQSGQRFSLPALWCLTGCLVFFAAASVLTVIPEPHYFSWSSAVTDLASGSAAAYGEALKERIVLYKSGEKNIEVEPLTAEPQLLYFSDIKTDPQDWENRALCRFYGLESVRVKAKNKD